MAMAKRPLDLSNIPYKRWKNMRHNYLVDVLDVQRFDGEATSYQVVLVRRVQGAQERAWPVDVFLKTFEPVGRKLRQKTIWDRLE